jgi:cysteine synthase
MGGTDLSDIRNGFVGAIGNTPLIRLQKASAATGCEILGKAEFLNPGGSVKDRAALQMILDAERSSRVPPAIRASASPSSATRAAIAASS